MPSSCCCGGAIPTSAAAPRPAALVGGAAVALPLLAGLVGLDYLDGRNLLPVFVPLILVLAAGFGVRRGGWPALGLAAAFCLCSLVFTLEIDRLPRLQREDLRNAAAEVGPLAPGVAVVTIRYATNQPLRYYLGAEFARDGAAAAARDRPGRLRAGRRSQRPARLLPAAFHLVESKPVSYDFTLTRFRSPHPVRVPLRVLERGALVGGGRRASVLISPGPWPGGESAAGR